LRFRALSRLKNALRLGSTLPNLCVYSGDLAMNSNAVMLAPKSISQEF
jgi:hypothetical protein